MTPAGNLGTRGVLERRLEAGPAVAHQNALSSCIGGWLGYDSVHMLPDFPQLKSELRDGILRAIQVASRVKAPLLAQIKTFLQHEGTVHSYDRIDAPSRTDAYEQIGVPIEITYAEVPDLVGERLASKIDAIAEDIARKEMELFHRKFSESAQEVGNAFDARGAPLTPELFFKMIEGVHMEFGPDGQLLGQFRTSPALAKVMQSWRDNPSIMAQYEALVNRKRDAWRDRENRRKLVD
jgi:hypothetical protein